MGSESGFNGWSRPPPTSIRTHTARRLRQDMTPQEVKVWNWLRDHFHPTGYKFRRQMRIGPYVVDFASLRPRVVIEIDGDQHAVGSAPGRDAERDEFLQKEGFVVIRYSNHEVGAGEEYFVENLACELERAKSIQPLPPAAPAPSPEGKDE